MVPEDRIGTATVADPAEQTEAEPDGVRAAGVRPVTPGACVMEVFERFVLLGGIT